MQYFIICVQYMMLISLNIYSSSNIGYIFIVTAILFHSVLKLEFIILTCNHSVRWMHVQGTVFSTSCWIEHKVLLNNPQGRGKYCR